VRVVVLHADQFDVLDLLGVLGGQVFGMQVVRDQLGRMSNSRPKCSMPSVNERRSRSSPDPDVV